jgi:hypothetical protein
MMAVLPWEAVMLLSEVPPREGRDVAKKEWRRRCCGLASKGDSLEDLLEDFAGAVAFLSQRRCGGYGTMGGNWQALLWGLGTKLAGGAVFGAGSVCWGLMQITKNLFYATSNFPRIYQ